jgi:hypothetical protein
MTTTTIKERLDDAKRRIDALGDDAKTASGESKARLERQVASLREQEASARAAKSAEADEKVRDLDERIKITQASQRAEVAKDKNALSDAVAAQLTAWDEHLDHLRAQASAKGEGAREQAAERMSHLRGVRDAAATRVAEVREASGEQWRERKAAAAAAFDKLEQKSDEVAAKLRHKPE